MLTLVWRLTRASVWEGCRGSSGRGCLASASSSVACPRPASTDMNIPSTALRHQHYVIGCARLQLLLRLLVLVLLAQASTCHLHYVIGYAGSVQLLRQCPPHTHISIT